MFGFDENPFDEHTTDNPFSDPAIQQVTSNVNAQIRIEDYDPFDNQSAMQPIQAPPSYTRTVQQPHTSVLDITEFQRKREELERKEEELARREEEMRHSSYNVRRSNWPPLPDQCCFQPCFYQDIQVDIPLDFQKIVRNLYYMWIYHGIMTIVNVFGGIIILNLNIIGFGILHMLLFTPFSYLCWFRPAYKAFRSDSSFNFMVFFFVFFFQFVVSVMQTIGIPISGTIGFITAFSFFDGTVRGTINGIIGLLIALGFGAAALGDLILISKIHRMYRSSGASFAKAQAEFTTEFLRNEQVRNAASNIAAAALQSQFN